MEETTRRQGFLNESFFVCSVFQAFALPARALVIRLPASSPHIRTEARSNVFKIQTLNNISRNGLDRLPANLYSVANEVAAPDAVLVRSADMHKAPIAASVKAIARAGAGTNNIPVAEMSARGVPVFNAPGANANAVKELVVAGMLLAARNIADALGFVRGLDASGDLHHKVEAEKKRFVCTELAGKTLGVVGLGAIGVKVAKAAYALGMRVMLLPVRSQVLNRMWGFLFLETFGQGRDARCLNRR